MGASQNRGGIGSLVLWKRDPHSHRKDRANQLQRIDGLRGLDKSGDNGSGAGARVIVTRYVITHLPLPQDDGSDKTMGGQ
jgi:hypothetical protein